MKNNYKSLFDKYDLSNITSTLEITLEITQLLFLINFF